MKKAIISDIHGNMDAFRQVLSDIKACGAEEVICLGDCVGYGPESEEVIRTVITKKIQVVMGNHELAIIDPSYRHRLNSVALKAILMAEKQLSEDSLEIIRNLPQFSVAGNCRFIHGFPPDSINTYLFQVSSEKLLRTLTIITEQICFIGHTHELKLVGLQESCLTRLDLQKGVHRLDPDMKYLINIGSVGQPRDGDNRAKYAIHDNIENTLEIRFVEYDIAAVVEKMESQGYPKSLSRRLW